MIVCGYEIQAGEKKHIKIPVLQAEAMEGICICGKIRENSGHNGRSSRLRVCGDRSSEANG